MKYVLFDMDGVLLDSEPGAFETFRKSLEKIGIYEKLDDLLNYVGVTTGDIAADLLKKHNSTVSVDDFLKMHRESGSYYEICADMKPMDGLIDLLEFLKKSSVKMAVVSSTSSKNVLITLNRLDILKYFDFVICGDTLKHGKPSPEGYLKAAGYLKAEPDECVVIEDSEAGVKAGKAAGMYVIAYKAASPKQNTEEADAQTNDLRKIKENIKKLMDN